MFNSNLTIAYRKTAFAERWLHANEFALRGTKLHTIQL